MIRVYVITLFFFFVIVHSGYAQYSNLRCRWIKPSEDGIKLDSLSVVPGSIEIKSPGGYTSTYSIASNLLTLSPAPLPDSILVCYRVYPFDLAKRVYKRDLSIYDSLGGYREVMRLRGYSNTPQQREELFSTPGINKTGVISRGLSVGNNQSVFVNSVLNLQLDGKLTENLTLTAVISDQNIPFQPEGNTQQLQQFDRVYIQLKTPKTALTVGDIVLKEQQSYFLRYYRNVQGGHIMHTEKKDSTFESITQGGIGVSKGKFNSMQFSPGTADVLLEGVQGPYRLRGANNEAYITIIANSERVYFDGRLLTRGFDYDYVIDYNTAEITLTPYILVTRYNRMRVDFEYTDKNYARTNTAISQSIKNKNGVFSFQYYTEKDNPRNPLLLDLSNADQIYLSTIGDDLTKAYIDGADSVGYTQGATLYSKTTVAGVDVYEYSTDPATAVYQVKFSQVAQGQGSYSLDNATTNARVYKYVGLPNGNYLPVQYIPTPKKKQMIQGSFSQYINKHEQVFSDIAFSQNDINLYSTLDKGDDAGMSVRAGVKSNKRDIGLLNKYLLTSTLAYELNEKNFSAIDRFRAADFERYWNEDVTRLGNNNMVTGNITYAKNASELMSYSLNYRNKESDLNGVQHQAQLYQKIGNLFFKGDLFLNNSNNYRGKANWERYNAHVYYKTTTITPGFQYNTEKNRVVDSSGNLLQSLMYFEEFKYYVTSNDTAKFRYKIDYSSRNDRQLFGNELLPYTKAQTVSFTSGIKFSLDHQLNFVTTYRYLNYVGPVATPGDETIMSRVDWSISALKRHIRSELTVTTGVGRQARQQFVFQPVATGLGTYVWRDYNNDRIQQINEFVTKIYNDTAEFIKIYLPSNDYYKAYTNLINYRLDMSMPRKWKSSNSFMLKTLSKLSNTSSITLNKKTTDDNLWERFNPASPSTSDTSLLAFQRVIRAIVFYNRSSSLFGMDLAYTANDSRQFLTQGFENQSINDLVYGLRSTFKRMYAWKIKLTTGFNSVNSDFNTVRNYYIEYKKADNEISYQPRTNLRFSILSGVAYKINTLAIGNGENAILYNIGTELKLNKLSKRTFTTTIKYIRINSRLNGTQENSPIAYEMQEALLSGNNMTWNVVWQERLTNGLQISFSYEGRKSESVKTIHTGRMQLSALF
ncbi:hypothetical protein [Cytophaga hutchinsonii]|uniref:Uncharacterized protein n=1 Tax=Cytophaga hutchinsonii (strain ATCC 33406 / DSM 1761 / CIP 103989 / NBRC 15051 / NCIMB 9469 / D465) TaxID=269798 RepID=A0A6N4SSN0_CYTH3|nr:hypothetical protein [Cytophaga hutchinsonii]ABG59459.1 hypothetical protein CHU_2196 [Cytophaga hutchinsonii ATCC 33406]SFX96476.1 hypothetical protein SAMN04487930_11527 [Cytophaga hutchinsonii ATCC 33406]